MLDIMDATSLPMAILQSCSRHLALSGHVNEVDLSILPPLGHHKRSDSVATVGGGAPIK